LIEPMQKVAVVCMTDDRIPALQYLRDLGIVHVLDVQAPESEELDDLTHGRDRAAKALGLLQARNVAAELSHLHSSTSLPPEQAVDEVLELANRLARLSEHAAQWRKARAQLEPWGSFSVDQIESIREGGLQVKLGTALISALPELPEGASLQVVSQLGKTAHFAVVAPVDVELVFPEVSLPDVTSIHEVDGHIVQCRADSETCEGRLDELVHRVPLISEFLDGLDADIEFAKTRDGMGATPGLCYLAGFAPAARVDELRSAATEHGWALQLSDVEGTDPQVPTLLRIPKIFETAKPIFDFIGILPGYAENDVSISVLLFLTLFFGIIIGDAGYGIIFLAVGLVLRGKVKAPSGRRWVNLFLFMSVVTTVWGWLSGNFFAIPAQYLPAPLRGCRWFTDVAVKDAHIQWLCFLIAAIHLSLGRAWQAVVRINTRAALGHIGWGLLIWGNFFMAVELIVAKGSFPKFAYGIYGVGAVLIMLFGVNWRDVGDVLNLPFDFIASFVDVLSYIRLFAVGLSSYFIASSFNSMGKMVYDLSPYLIVVAIIVIVLGHLLNVALGIMGVLVHGIRLNTLEFSNHMGLTWSGRPYTPFSHVKRETD